MTEKSLDLINILESVGPTPTGADYIDHVIASLPPKELTAAAKCAEASYGFIEPKVPENATYGQRYQSRPYEVPSLATDILYRQHRLSKTRRQIAVLASVVLIGLAGSFTGRELDRSTQRQLYQFDGYNPHDFQYDASEEAQAALILGTAGSILGGVLGYAFAVAQAGRLAKKPAQRKVANSTDELHIYRYDSR